MVLFHYIKVRNITKEKKIYQMAKQKRINNTHVFKAPYL